YGAVDVPIGLVAVDAARRHRARLVYVAAHHTPALSRTAYVAAHERVAEAMQDVDGCVVRATGFFSAFATLVPMARRGWLADVGNGRARSTPISEHALAAIVADAVTGSERVVAAGGPEVLTRAEMFALIAAVPQRRVRIARLPLWLGRIGSAMLRLV